MRPGGIFPVIDVEGGGWYDLIILFCLNNRPMLFSRIPAGERVFPQGTQ